jgi:hypothetical protein
MALPIENGHARGPYASAAQLYWQAGWAGVLPVPLRAKGPPPNGYTGASGIWPSFPDIHAWCEGREGAGNLGLRLPAQLVGIDVDAYGLKKGRETLEKLSAEFGPLPPAWRATSRGDGVSGIALYAVPPSLAWPGDLGAGVEVIQFRHRYALAWPSIHPDTGATYRWINPAGHDVIGAVPSPGDLAEMPESWVQGVTAGRYEAETAKADLDDEQAAAWLTRRAGKPADAPCRAVRDALARYVAQLQDGAHARHDVALAASTRLAHLAGDGHLGVLTALAAFQATWELALATGDKRAPTTGEWARLLGGAVRIAAAEHPETRGGDPCDDPFHDLIPGVFSWPSSPSFSSAGVTATTTAAPVTFTSSTTAPAEAAAGASTASASAMTGPSLAPEELAHRREQALRAEIERQRAQRGARAFLAAEEATAAFREPVGASLADELAMPDEPVPFLVNRVFPSGANVLLTAQFKAGKTSTVNHLTKAIVDGEPFLGAYAVSLSPGNVALWNYEVTAAMNRRWLREVGIAAPARVRVLNLRGQRLSLIAPIAVEWAVRWLSENEISVWILDPFARAFLGSGDSENDNAQVGAFLETLDIIKARAGVSELVMVSHTGRGIAEVGAERSRGATRLDDWADVRWLLTLDAEEQRFFRAIGRDVEEPEGRIEWDAERRQPTLLTNSGRKQSMTLRHEVAILDACRLTPGLSQNTLFQVVGGRREVVKNAANLLVGQGRIRLGSGPRNAVTYWPVDDFSDMKSDMKGDAE